MLDGVKATAIGTGRAFFKTPKFSFSYPKSLRGENVIQIWHEKKKQKKNKKRNSDKLYLHRNVSSANQLLQLALLVGENF